jgi:hypothetical protein
LRFGVAIHAVKSSQVTSESHAVRNAIGCSELNTFLFFSPHVCESLFKRRKESKTSKSIGASTQLFGECGRDLAGSAVLVAAVAALLLRRRHW